MGDALIAELLKYRPPKPGEEWWLLLDLAADAGSDRRTACGFEYMAERTKASRATIYRWLAKLTEAGLIVVVERSKSAGRNGGKGRRAVYEIQIPPAWTAAAAARLLKDAELLNGVSQKGTRFSSEPEGAAPNRVSPCMRPHSDDKTAGQPRGGANGVSRSMRPPGQDPLRTAPVEGAWLRPDQDLRSDDKDKKIFVGPEREARRAPAA